MDELPEGTFVLHAGFARAENEPREAFQESDRKGLAEALAMVIESVVGTSASWNEDTSGLYQADFDRGDVYVQLRLDDGRDVWPYNMVPSLIRVVAQEGDETVLEIYRALDARSFYLALEWDERTMFLESNFVDVSEF
ncbi:hypothetical protein [Streptomyces sp. NPDC012508]|uniref:hypothetical protein n=1 Tax=Streptomyces sp. NPDC012508 TaxID=3364837 RepID=UPI0036C647ED